MKNKLNILIVFGTRPEAIKMAPVIKEMQSFPDQIKCRVCVTGQHRQMIDPLLKLFEIKPDIDLDLMKANQSLEHITTTVLHEIGTLIDKEKPDYLFVQGDTTTAMAAGLAAFYKKVKVGHIEAGLRTGNIHHPYPEEVNRRIIDSMADVYFAHTDNAKENLVNEGVAEEKIEVTGNTVIDALLQTAEKPVEGEQNVIDQLQLNGRKMILMTAHRRENFGGPLEDICKSIRSIAERYQDFLIVYPVHLNPNIKGPVNDLLNGIDNVKLIEPLDYHAFVHLMKQSYFVLTDSGGIQEEAPSLGKPVLVMRETTERPEGVEAGCVEVIGTDVNKMVEAASGLIEDQDKYDKMAHAANPYGDGNASAKIVQFLLKQNRDSNHEKNK